MKKKILYIATSFPKPEKGATIYTDLAEELQNNGHKLTVAVSEQKRNQKTTTYTDERGISVLRISVGDFYDVGFIKKGLSLVKMPLLMKKGIAKYIKEKKFDLILFESPPVTNASLVKWAKRKYKANTYLMLKDIFPQNAVDIGVLKEKGMAYRYFKNKEKKLYEIADYIGCMSKANREYLLKKNKNIKEEKVGIFPNTKKIIKLNLENKDLTIRLKLGIPKEAKVFLFGGNMGKPQNIELLKDAVISLKEDKDIFFVFVGRGTERYILEKAVRDYSIKNVLVLENLPREEYEKVLEIVDIGLIVLDPRFTIPNYPSRILSYMEYGKPVLAATDMNTDFGELIQNAKCGKWVYSGDLNGFIDAIREVASDKNLIKMGKNGRDYLEENFNVTKSVELLEKYMESLEEKK